MNSDMIFSQVQEGQLPDEVRIFHPPQFPLIGVIIFGIIYAVLIFFACALIYVLILMMTGNEAIIDSSYWPVYSHYPYLIIPQLLLPFLLIYFNRCADKRQRDTAIVLLPEGFVQYTSWSDKNRRWSLVIDYKNIEEIIYTSSSLDVIYKNGDHYKVYILPKYRSSDSEAIVQQIIRDYHHFGVHTKLE